MDELAGFVAPKRAMLALNRGMLLGLEGLLGLGLVALRRGLQLGQTEGSRGAEGAGRRGGGRVGLSQLLLGLQLLPLEELVVVAQMGRDARVDVVLFGHVGLDQPRRAVPRLPRHRLLDEGAQDRLGEDLAVAENARVVHHRLLVWSLIQADKVAREGRRQRAVGQNLAAKARLVPYHAV